MPTTDKKLLDALTSLERGDWQHAHTIVQEHETHYGYWLHGLVHLMEGDRENAQYWYKRAKRVFSTDTQSELAAARAALDQA